MSNRIYKRILLISLYLFILSGTHLGLVTQVFAQTPSTGLSQQEYTEQRNRVQKYAQDYYAENTQDLKNQYIKIKVAQGDFSAFPSLTPEQKSVQTSYNLRHEAIIGVLQKRLSATELAALTQTGREAENNSFATRSTLLKKDGQLSPEDQKRVEENLAEADAIKAGLEAQRIEAERRSDEAKKLAEEEIKIECPNAFSPLNDASLGEMATCMLAKLTYFYVLTFANYILSFVSSFFNAIIDLTVVNMKATLGLCTSASANAACVDNDTNIINTGWILFRDISNILFIFVLIYTAIRTILFGTGDTGKTIATVIAVAVLINFSMFFTKVVIDISNTLSLSFYQSIIAENKAQFDSASSKGSVVFDEKDVIGQLVHKSSVTTIVNHVKEANVNASTPLNYSMIFKQSLLGTVFIVILIVILILMSLMLLARVLILGFVIMTSALAVASFILPDFKHKIFDKWFPALLGQSFFVPTFMLFLLLSIKFLSAFKIGSNDTVPTFSNLATSTGIASATQGAIHFALVAGMLIISMKIAKSMADQAGSASGKITGFLGTATLGTAGWAARGLLGVPGKWIRSAGDRLDSDGLRGVGNFLANRTYDMRNMPGVGYLSQDSIGKTGTEITMHEYFEKLEKEKKKGEEEAVKAQEKGYKDAGKIKPEQQLVININEKRKTLNQSVFKIKTDMQAKIDNIEEKVKNKSMTRQEADDRISNIMKSDGVALAKAENDLQKHKNLHKQYKTDDDIAKAAGDILDKVKEAQKEYIKGRRSEAGKKFVVEQAVRDEKLKNENDELVAALKNSQSSNSGGGGNKKP